VLVPGCLSVAVDIATGMAEKIFEAEELNVLDLAIEIKVAAPVDGDDEDAAAAVCKRPHQQCSGGPFLVESAEEATPSLLDTRMSPMSSISLGTSAASSGHREEQALPIEIEHFDINTSPDMSKADVLELRPLSFYSRAALAEEADAIGGGGGGGRRPGPSCTLAEALKASDPQAEGLKLKGAAPGGPGPASSEARRPPPPSLLLGDLASPLRRRQQRPTAATKRADAPLDDSVLREEALAEVEVLLPHDLASSSPGGGRRRAARPRRRPPPLTSLGFDEEEEREQRRQVGGLQLRASGCGAQEVACDICSVM